MSSKEKTLLKIWYALDVVIAATACEAVEYGLMEAGAMGTEVNENVLPGSIETPQVLKVPAEGVQLVITGYFEQVPERERVRSELAEALRIYELPSSSVLEMNVREVANQDWLGEWKKNWQPLEVGRFIIAPPWSELPFVRDRIVIRIEPGMAFGTGTHETTRLCLAAIEKYFEGGSFLDVGTGTGILAIAAAKLFPEATIRACDTDADAVEIARENARLNETADRIAFDVGSVDESTASADLVCANLTAGVIKELLPSLLGVSCGRLILSGILETQLKDVLTSLNDCGVSSPVETMQDGEWTAIVI